MPQNDTSAIQPDNRPGAENEESTEKPAQAKPNFLTILRNSNFRNLWLGQIVSQIGDYFAFLTTTVVVSGFSNDTQATTLAVSGMMLANSLPRLLFGMLAGVFVDRWDRRITMFWSDVIRISLALGMIPAFLNKNLWAMYALGFLMSTIGTLFMPAKGALIPKLVPQEHLVAANSLSQTSQMLAVLLGPALAGGTLKLAGPGNEWVAFAVDAASFLISALTIWLIRVPRKVAGPAVLTADAGAGRSSIGRVWTEMLVGVRMLFLDKTVATLAAVFAITMLGVGAINVLWVVYLKLRFGFEGPELAWRFGLLDVLFAVGMIASTVIAGNFTANTAPKWFIVVALIGSGVSLGSLVYLPDYWTMAVAQVVLGAFVAPINIGSTTLMQIVVPNDKLGRVGGGIGTLIETATVTSMSLAGFLAVVIGVPAVFVIAGALCALGGILAWVRLPAVTLKDKPQEPVVSGEQGRVMDVA